MVERLARLIANGSRAGQALLLLLLAVTGLFVVAMTHNWLRTAAVAVALVALVLLAAAVARIARLAFVGMFALAYFVFLLGRWVATLPSDRLYTEFSLDVTRHTLVALFVGVVSVAVVPVLVLLRREDPARRPRRADATPAGQQFPRLAWLLLVGVVACGVLRVIENVLIARGVWQTGYVNQFVSSTGLASPALHYPSLMYDAFLAVFIAWRPRRLLIGLGLALHVVVMASSLLTGQRIYAVVWTAVLVALLASAPPPWLGPLLRRRAIPFAIATVVLVGAGIGGLTAVETLRSGSAGSGFLESQGVSYVVVAYADERAADLPESNGSYTFGRLETTLTGGATYPGGSVDDATRGDNLGATVSWLVQPTVYAVGGGFGTSYVAELDTDFGPWGVGLYGLLLGAALVSLSSLSRRGWITVAVAILLARSLVIMPRDFTLNWVFPFLSVSVLAPLVLSVVIVLVVRRYGSRARR